ncbi:phosphogluconate dehydrogenase (decarboxylating), NAD binding domain protein [SAR86 cluster bacterium SAR86E]|uniref:Phosphogluconate dehydrogenase (Decarboxylating), NAD binding domain protein n=1 Tax=SAR86 cluster bacterium SAR86E TaxID=1208365 RepID=K6FF62_9GAMM|nr:phosphogluconate dehydrogenase (decarboxylating), NAD binding domain protein [SAR86 cluster bacterium SAR86E]
MQKYKKKYLFVGLGTMGFPMAGHLSKNPNVDLYVFNRTQSKTKLWLTKYNGKEYVFETNDIKFDGIITCLKDDHAITNSLLDSSLISSLQDNSFILDHSTTSLELVNQFIKNEIIIKKNVDFYDAPISGGEIAAVNGTLSVMIGGSIDNFSKISTFISAYTKSITHIGESGHGQIAKMMNQLSIAGTLQGLSESIVFGKKYDVDLGKVFEAISNGAAQSWQMDNRFKTMVSNEYDFGFAIRLMIKDLGIILSEAQKQKLQLSIGKQTFDEYKKLDSEGYGKLDTSALVKKFHD